jgi:hypothetical protein
LEALGTQYSKPGSPPIIQEVTMALKNLFNQARKYATSPEGRRLISQGKSALRQRGTKGNGTSVRRQPGASGIMDLAQRFLGRGGSAGTTRRY